MIHGPIPIRAPKISRPWKLLIRKPPLVLADDFEPSSSVDESGALDIGKIASTIASFFSKRDRLTLGNPIIVPTANRPLPHIAQLFDARDNAGRHPVLGGPGLHLSVRPQPHAARDLATRWVFVSASAHPVKSDFVGVTEPWANSIRWGYGDLTRTLVQMFDHVYTGELCIVQNGMNVNAYRLFCPFFAFQRCMRMTDLPFKCQLGQSTLRIGSSTCLGLLKLNASSFSSHPASSSTRSAPNVHLMSSLRSVFMVRTIHY